MNDIRSTLTAAMYSRPDIANEGTEPIKSANDEQIQADATRSGQHIDRPEEMTGKLSKSGPRNSNAVVIAVRGEGAGRSAAAFREFELQIERFKTAQDTAGNPLYPNYADIEPEMAAIALAYSARGRTIPPLRELYEKAVWTNPALRKALGAVQHGLGEASRDAEPKLRTASTRNSRPSGRDAREPKRAPTTQSSSRALRDEILAHLDGD